MLSKEEFLLRIADFQIESSAKRILDELAAYQGGGAHVHKVCAAAYPLINLLTAIENGKVKAKTFSELSSDSSHSRLFDKLYESYVNGGYML